MLKLFLIEAGLDIKASEDEKYDMTISASKGEPNIDAMRFCIKELLMPIKE